MSRRAPEVAEPPSSLHDYAFLGDGERGVLVGPHGDFAWMCFPRWSSPPLFNALVGGPGSYLVSPVGRKVWGGYYEEATLIWHSRWATADGIIECHEALALPSRPDRLVLLRRIRALESDARVSVLLRLDPSGAGVPMRTVRRSRGGVWTLESEGLRLRWTGAEKARLDPTTGALAFELDVRREASHDLVLELSTSALETESPSAERLWASTRRKWRSRRAPPVCSSRESVMACAVLSGLTTHEGAMVDAATTSLPERAGGGKNYDYRYAWIRDQCIAGCALAEAGLEHRLDACVKFVTERILADGVELRPAYTVEGGDVPSPRPLKAPGYPGAPEPVVGNKVQGQFQLDGFGEALLLFSAAAKLGGLSADAARAAELCHRAIAERWETPDSGVWELKPRWWTHSRLVCAGGLREFSKHVGRGRARWTRLADGLVKACESRSTARSGAWKRAPDDGGVDGALLSPGVALAGGQNHSRNAATLREFERTLMKDGFAYRFAQGSAPLGKAEGAFLICQFWLAEARLRERRWVDAVRAYEKGAAASGSPGIFTEEFDVGQRQQRGNSPQAFVHATLLGTGLRLERALGGGALSGVALTSAPVASHLARR